MDGQTTAEQPLIKRWMQNRQWSKAQFARRFFPVFQEWVNRVPEKAVSQSPHQEDEENAAIIVVRTETLQTELITDIVPEITVKKYAKGFRLTRPWRMK